MADEVRAAPVRTARPALARSLRRSLIWLCGGLVGGTGVLLAILLVHPDSPPWAYWGYTAVCWLYFVAGCVAWWRRPSNGMGALIVWGGVSVSLLLVGSTAAPLLAALGTAAGTLPLAVVVHLLLAFPSGRLRRALPWAVVAAGYVVTLVLQFPLYAFDARMSALPLFVADRPDLLRTGIEIQRYAGALVMAVTAVVLVVRLRRAKPWQRRILVPLFGYGVLAVLFIPLSPNLFSRWFDWSPFAIGVSQLVAISGVPVAFALAVLLGGFARTGEVEELSSWLSAPTAERSGLSAALAAVLGDPLLEIAFRVPGRLDWVDSAGRPVGLPAPGDTRAAVPVELSGEVIAAIVYDSELIADPELVRAAGRVVALGVERERLTAALRASEQSLRRSRERLVETADRERRRIAQDLHDGLQVTLVLLAIQAQQLAHQPGATSAHRTGATDLRRGIDAAAAELRSLVHAVMPSSLLERGLGLAAEDLVDRLPVPAELVLGDVEPLPTPVASTAYFVVAEALTNVVKHAAASKVVVRLELVGGNLLVDVRDDGRGGASRDHGTGLRGLADRVDVLGGSLTLDSPAGGGTRLSVQLPVSQQGPDATAELARAQPDDRPRPPVLRPTELTVPDPLPVTATQD
ncbi:sensor histidine kinase [Nakamurella endophytica]|uniref:histidine kinase n=1 Tax=Nakamurella endophytica TaxID=1748367 RepID=A0A917T6Q1_9ACTN|nr:ATP-binding protein [Nakamurella endophytica]GGM12527.1 hypothetical protein GCM10011594_35510 [Nakamurella endophytica]